MYIFHLKVTAVVKYWLGGPDPLDYISMFANPGTIGLCPIDPPSDFEWEVLTYATFRSY